MLELWPNPSPDLSSKPIQTARLPPQNRGLSLARGVDRQEHSHADEHHRCHDLVMAPVSRRLKENQSG